MGMNHDSTIATDTVLPRINRRTFLIGGAQVAVCIVALASDYLIIAAARPKPAPMKSYGTGAYGRGAFSGPSVYTVYLPTVAKEENEHGAFTGTGQ
jgi:hypothetical protein